MDGLRRGRRRGRPGRARWPRGTWRGSGARVALVDGSHPREKPCGGGVTGRALELVGDGLATPAGGQTIDSVTFEAGGRDAPECRCRTRDYLQRVPARRRSTRPCCARPSTPARRTSARASAGHRARPGSMARDGGPRLRSRRRGCSAPTGPPASSASRCSGRSSGGSSRSPPAPTSTASRPREIVIGFVDRAARLSLVVSAARPSRRRHVRAGERDDRRRRCTPSPIAGSIAYAPAAGRERRRYSWPIPSLEARDVDAEQPAGDGWMLLGDAAGLVDPITREGIFFAAALGDARGRGARRAARPRARTPTRCATSCTTSSAARRASRRASSVRASRALLIDALNQSAGHPRRDAGSRRRPPALSRPEAPPARNAGARPDVRVLTSVTRSRIASDRPAYLST